MAQSSFIVASSTAVDTTFVQQSSDSKSVGYINDATTLELPLGADISHDNKAPGAKGTDRHLIKFRHTVKDDNGEVGTCVASFQLSIPRNSAVTDVIIKDLAAFCINYVNTAGNLDKLIDGITP